MHAALGCGVPRIDLSPDCFALFRKSHLDLSNHDVKTGDTINACRTGVRRSQDFITPLTGRYLNDIIIILHILSEPGE